MQEKFEEKIKEDTKEKSIVINMNYGIADTDQNYEIRSLLAKYQTLHNIILKDNENLFMIINNTNERFVFKQFKTSTELIISRRGS